ncbi:putative leucine-rich repeat-containing protein DDB_G0290503 isoform X2 [Centruroides vittatus]|uniref:putative leucine-rich repeat-containing protein DDB_G0290503 isoform X2 n=1 Tax=Centruroides vittatus TaxID=120091 RepID=UPI00350EE876
MDLRDFINSNINYLDENRNNSVKSCNGCLIEENHLGSSLQSTLGDVNDVSYLLKALSSSYKRLFQMDEDDYQDKRKFEIKLKTIQKCFEYLIEQNELLVTTILELEKEASKRVIQMENRLHKSAKSTMETVIHIRECEEEMRRLVAERLHVESVFEDLQHQFTSLKIENGYLREQNANLHHDINGLLHIIQQARSTGNWELDSMTFCEVTPEQVFGPIYSVSERSSLESLNLNQSIADDNRNCIPSEIQIDNSPYHTADSPVITHKKNFQNNNQQSEETVQNKIERSPIQKSIQTDLHFNPRANTDKWKMKESFSSLKESLSSLKESLDDIRKIKRTKSESFLACLRMKPRERHWSNYATIFTRSLPIDVDCKNLSLVICDKSCFVSNEKNIIVQNNNNFTERNRRKENEICSIINHNCEKVKNVPVCHNHLCEINRSSCDEKLLDEVLLGIKKNTVMIQTEDHCGIHQSVQTPWENSRCSSTISTQTEVCELKLLEEKLEDMYKNEKILQNQKRHLMVQLDEQGEELLKTRDDLQNTRKKLKIYEKEIEQLNITIQTLQSAIVQSRRSLDEARKMNENANHSNHNSFGRKSIGSLIMDV